MPHVPSRVAGLIRTLYPAGEAFRGEAAASSMRRSSFSKATSTAAILFGCLRTASFLAMQRSLFARVIHSGNGFVQQKNANRHRLSWKWLRSAIPPPSHPSLLEPTSAPKKALFCKFRSVSPIAFLLFVISVGFSVKSGLVRHRADGRRG